MDSNNSDNRDMDVAVAVESRRQPARTRTAAVVEEPPANAQSAKAALPRAERGFQASVYHSGFNTAGAYEPVIADVGKKAGADPRPTESSRDHWQSRSRQKYNLIMDNVIPSIKTD